MALPLRRLQLQPAGFNPVGTMDLLSDPQNLPGMDIDKATDLPDTKNLHRNLERILEKFKLDPEHIASIKDMYNQEKISDINSQLKLMKLSINNSKKIAFNLSSFESKYPLVCYLIRSKMVKTDKISNENYTNKNVDYNDLFNGLTVPAMENLRVGEIIRFRAMTNISSVDNHSNNEIMRRFNQELNSRNLPNSYLGDQNLNNQDSNYSDSKICDRIISQPASTIVSKKFLLDAIGELESIYGQIIKASEWKNYMEYLKKITETSFEQYCSASKNYQYVEQLDKQIKSWISEYDKLIKRIRDENKKNSHLSDNNKFDSILAHKYDSDQEFLTEMLQLLDIDKYKSEMEHAAKIFSMHHQLVNDFIQPFAKSNICRICLFDEANQFISTCGHVICLKCAGNLSGDSNLMGDFYMPAQRSLRCPYCSKDFQMTDLKKIFY